MIRLLTILAATSLGLSGCISLLPDSGDLPPRVTLDPGAPRTAIAAPRFAKSLVIADPSAAAVFNSFYVALEQSPLEYQYMADAEWTDRVPVLLRRFLERRFANQGLFTAVADRADLPVGDYTMQTDIRAFQIDIAGSDDVARVSLGVRLLDKRGSVIATKVFEVRSISAGATRTQRVAALNSASQEIADQIIDWVADLVSAHVDGV